MFYSLPEEELRTICRVNIEAFKKWARTVIHSELTAQLGENYDIICSDAKKHLADATENKDDAQIQLTVFSHYYSAFRAESRKRPNMHTVLVKALETAGQYYSPLDRYTRAAHAL